MAVEPEVTTVGLGDTGSLESDDDDTVAAVLSSAAAALLPDAFFVLLEKRLLAVAIELRLDLVSFVLSRDFWERPEPEGRFEALRNAGGRFDVSSLDGGVHRRFVEDLSLISSLSVPANSPCLLFWRDAATMGLEISCSCSVNRSLSESPMVTTSGFFGCPLLPDGGGVLVRPRLLVGVTPVLLPRLLPWAEDPPWSEPERVVVVVAVGFGFGDVFLVTGTRRIRGALRPRDFLPSPLLFPMLPR